MLIKPNTLVLVKWVDIVGDDNWLTKKEAEKTRPHPFVSVGWVLTHDKQAISIVSCYSPEDDTVGSVTSIPTGAVLNITRLNRVMKLGPPSQAN